MIQFIKLFNLNFENYLDKFTNPRKNLSDELELATFVYRIEDTYLNFAKTHQSAANINIPAFSDVIKELENKIQKLINFTTLSICKKNHKKTRFGICGYIQRLMDSMSLFSKFQRMFICFCYNSKTNCHSNC